MCSRGGPNARAAASPHLLCCPQLKLLCPVVCSTLLPVQGPGKGTPCIDDYIKSAEPVYDYLTKFRCV